MPSPLDQPETSTPSQRIDNDASIAQPLAVELPPAGDSRQTSDKGRAVEADGEEVHTLDVGEGNVVKLDRLGPMIINSDGVSLSRCRLSRQRKENVLLGGRSGNTKLGAARIGTPWLIEFLSCRRAGVTD